MSISQDHSQMPVHAHTMVAGWLMSAVFAFFYHLFPLARERVLAKVHFWLAALSSLGMFIGLFVLYGGNPSIEPVLGLSAMAYFVATILFAYIAIATLWRGETAGAASRVAAG